jgi:hypothetical protein
MSGLTLEGYDACRGVITSGVETGRRGDISCHLLVTHDGYKLVEGFIQSSGGLRLLVEPLLHLLEPFIIHGRGVNNFQ